MLRFYHAPYSRSMIIATALREMDIAEQVETVVVDIARVDGTGTRDAQNPHPEGKVPLLVHDDVLVWERPAILTYLSDLFPLAPAICPVGHPERGAFLSWLAYYGDVVEPVLLLEHAQVSHDLVHAAFRGSREIHQRLEQSLADGRDYLLKSGFTTADTLMASIFAYYPEAVPNIPSVTAWVDRVNNREHGIDVVAADGELMAT